MGGSPPPPPPPSIVYAPPPPPPAPPKAIASQSLQTQTALNEVSNAQARMNMEIGAQLDRSNAEFFSGQDIRKIQSVGAEQRLATAVSGEQERATRLAAGEQERKTNLQQEMFRRYKENRDYEQAQSQYRT